jgi:hypothetical protein
MVDFGTRLDLEQRMTAQRLVEMFDDDGDGVIAGTDLATLTTVIDEANDIVAGILLNKGYTAEQLETIRLDKQVTRAWSGIAAQLAGERKPEWCNDRGQGPYDAQGARGRAELKALAIGETRSIQEATAGRNLGLVGEVSRANFQFAPDPNNPNDRNGPGGF